MNIMMNTTLSCEKHSPVPEDVFVDIAENVWGADAWLSGSFLAKVQVQKVLFCE